MGREEGRLSRGRGHASVTKVGHVQHGSYTPSQLPLPRHLQEILVLATGLYQEKAPVTTIVCAAS